MFGVDFRALFQLATWKELAAVECGAIYNRNRTKGECFATGYVAGSLGCENSPHFNPAQP